MEETPTNSETSEDNESLPQKKKPQGSLNLRHSRNNKVYYDQFPNSRVFKLSADLEKELREYLRQNSISLNQLCHLALSQFISVPQKIELAPVPNSKARLWGEKVEIESTDSTKSNRRTVSKDESPNRSARFTAELDLRVQEYLAKNDLSFNQLCQFAIGKFISVQQVMVLSEVPEKRAASNSSGQLNSELGQ